MPKADGVVVGGACTALPYRYMDNVALADLAFEAQGRTLDELFSEAVDAVTGAMVDISTLKGEITEKFSVESDELELLLYKVLSEVVFLKDAEALLFARARVSVTSGSGLWKATIDGRCDRIDPSRHALRTDVKAVTMHDLRIRRVEDGSWMCTVTLDV